MRFVGMWVAAMLFAVGCGGGAVKEACAANYAGCQSFTDATAANANRTITFGGALGNAYAPNCLEVKRGQSVTFSGDFTLHPLDQGCGVKSSLEVPVTGINMSATATFHDVGDYGYYCQLHGAPGGTGMAGVIRVVE